MNEIQFEEIDGYILAKASAQATTEELISFLSGIIPSWQHKDVIWDLTEFTFEKSYLHIISELAEAISQKRIDHTKKVALVIANEKAFQKIKAFISIANLKGDPSHYQLFYDLDIAKAWVHLEMPNPE